MLSLFWGHAALNEGLGELGALQWGAENPGMCFCHLKQVLKFKQELSEMFLGLQLFVVTALAFSGFLSPVVPLVFAFICLFIYFENPHFTEGICSEGISGLSRQFLTLFTQDIWLVYIRDT